MCVRPAGVFISHSCKLLSPLCSVLRAADSHTHTHTGRCVERVGLLGAEEETLWLFCMFIYDVWILQMFLVSSLLSVNVRSHPLVLVVCRRADRFCWWHLNKQVIIYMQKQKGGRRNVVLAPGERRWLYISLWFGGKSAKVKETDQIYCPEQ